MRRWTSLVGALALLGCENVSSPPDATTARDASVGERDAIVLPLDAPALDDAPSVTDAAMGEVDAFMPSVDAGGMGLPSARGPFAVTPSMATVTRGMRMTTVRVFLPTLPEGSQPAGRWRFPRASRSCPLTRRGCNRPRRLHRRDLQRGRRLHALRTRGTEFHPVLHGDHRCPPGRHSGT